MTLSQNTQRRVLFIALLALLLLCGCAQMNPLNNGWIIGEEIEKLEEGMTYEEVVEVAGRPNRKNRTGGKYDTRDQWVYDYPMTEGYKVYLYFEDGRLTSWQY